MSSSHKLDAEKEAMRAQALARRASLFQALGGPAAEAISEAVVTALRGREAQTVAGYWPLPGEMDPRPAMMKLAAAGQRIALPVVVGPAQPLVFRAWRVGMALEKGAHETWHPPAEAEEVWPDVVLAPVLAFDRSGVRLGFGGGYYDRTLAALRRRGPVWAVGVAFAGQEVDALPRDRHDQTLDLILTEEGPVTPRGTATA